MLRSMRDSCMRLVWSAVFKNATAVNQIVDWGTSGFKAITWRKVELVRDLLLQVRSAILQCCFVYAKEVWPPEDRLEGGVADVDQHVLIGSASLDPDPQPNQDPYNVAKTSPAAGTLCRGTRY